MRHESLEAITWAVYGDQATANEAVLAGPPELPIAISNRRSFQIARQSFLCEHARA